MIPTAPSQLRYRRAMATVYDLLHDPHPELAATKYVRAFTAVLIVLNIVAVILESVQAIEAAVGFQLHLFDLFSVAVFTVEYGFRVWSAPLREPHAPAWRARFNYARSFFGLVDLFAILPFYVHFFFTGDLRIVRALRLLRLERLVMLGRYSLGLRMLGRAVQRTKHELYASFAVIAMMLLITSSLIYFVEHEAQPDKFASIPESLWWGVITLTSVGYGDVYPMTALGKVLGGVIALLGLGLAALPSGLIAGAFVEEFKQSRDRDACREVAVQDGQVVCPNCRHTFHTIPEPEPEVALAIGEPDMRGFRHEGGGLKMDERGMRLSESGLKIEDR